MQGFRTSNQAELKRKEKEIERIMERWQKLADLQSKVGAAQSGIKCANASVVDGVQAVGKGQGFLDIALEQAEQARRYLSDENLFLRKLALKAVNELHSLLHKTQRMLPGECTAEEVLFSFFIFVLYALLKLLQPTSLTMTTFFVPSPDSAANDKLDRIVSSLNSALSGLQEVQTVPSQKSITTDQSEEIEKLRGIITRLQEELGISSFNTRSKKSKCSAASSQKQALTHMAEAQVMFDRFAEDHRSTTGEICEISMELLSAPLRDEAKERLEELRHELDSERQRFTEAAVKLGKEKAALEVSSVTTIIE